MGVALPGEVVRGLGGMEQNHAWFLEHVRQYRRHWLRFAGIDDAFGQYDARRGGEGHPLLPGEAQQAAVVWFERAKQRLQPAFAGGDDIEPGCARRLGGCFAYCIGRRAAPIGKRTAPMAQGVRATD